MQTATRRDIVRVFSRTLHALREECGTRE